ncbi:unnamed protein product [Ixodes hexagonus]
MAVNIAGLGRVPKHFHRLGKNVPLRGHGCVRAKSTKPPKTTIVCQEYDGVTRTPVKSVNAAAAIKKLNFENLSLFGPVLKSSKQRKLDSQIDMRLSYLDERVPRRIRAPKLACEELSKSTRKVRVIESGYRDIPEVEYADSTQAQQHEAIRAEKEAFKVGRFVRREVPRPSATLQIPTGRSDKEVTLDFPIFNYLRDDLSTDATGDETEGVSSAETKTEASSGFPSVTAILRDTMDPLSKRRLELWKEKMVAELGQEGFAIYQELLLNRGKSLHRNIHELLSGRPKEEVSVEPENAGHWASVQDLLREISPVRYLETPVSHPHLQYHGIADCLISSPLDNGRRCLRCFRDQLVLIDWKTSKKPKPRLSDTFDNPLQVAAYIGALNYDDNYKIQVKEALIVIAYEDGSPCQVHRMGPVVCQRNWERWLQRLGTYWDLVSQDARASL